MLSSCCLQDECTAHRCLCFTIHTSALGRPDRAVVYFTYGLVHGSPWLYLGGLETGPSWRKRVNGNWVPVPGLACCFQVCRTETRMCRVLLLPWSHIAHAFPPQGTRSPLIVIPKSAPLLWSCFSQGFCEGTRQQEDEQLTIAAGPG